MKAALCTAPNMPLEYVEIALDNPKAHEVLVRTKAVGLCHSDLHFIDGNFPFPMPFIPGHEASGIVEKVGSEVTRLKPGDHVVTVLGAYCGHCEHCTAGKITLCQDPATKRSEQDAPRIKRPNNKPVNQFLNLSAFAEQMLVHESSCVAVSPDISLDRAALMGCALITGAGAVFNDCAVMPGESVAVIGCGGIGLAAINAAAIAGAGEIIAIDPVAAKRDLALKMGATQVYDAMQPDLAANIIEYSRGGVHKVIEAVGKSQTVALACEITRRGGVTTVLGLVPPDDPITIPGLTFLQGKTLKGSVLGSSPFPVTVPRLVDFYLKGRLQLDLLINQHLPFSQINQGLDHLRSGEHLRTIISFDD